MKYSDEERRHALVLYLEGCGFRRIVRAMSQIFGHTYRYQTITNWVKSAVLKTLKKIKARTNRYSRNG